MFVVEVLGHVRFVKPGVIFGSNAITVYVLAGILSPLFYELNFRGASLNMHFFRLFTGAGIHPQLVSALYAFLYVCIIYVPAWLLYRRRIFIKL
jgi:predicted acyltransferase